jgi:Tfp pilus assembly protein FimT
MFVLTIMVSVAIVAAVAMAVVPFGVDLADRQRAQTAADAAALAGVHGGQSASVELAAANGATLVAWAQSGRSVTVTVVRRDATASARATDEP